MVEHIKNKISDLVDEYYKKEEDNSSFKKIVPTLIKKGLENVNLSMFSEERKKELLEAVGDEFLRRDQKADALKMYAKVNNTTKINEVGKDGFPLQSFT